MKKDFYYAALDLTLTLEDSHDDFLKTLTDNEFLVLQNNLWLTISGFLTARALYLKDNIESLERVEQAIALDKDKESGG